jgi:hypothetical protein
MVKAGQIWVDKSARTFRHRFLLVEALSTTHAFCVRCNVETGEIVGNKIRPHASRIRLDRFGYSYELLKDVVPH